MVLLEAQDQESKQLERRLLADSDSLEGGCKPYRTQAVGGLRGPGPPLCCVPLVTLLAIFGDFSKAAHGEKRHFSGDKS